MTRKIATILIFLFALGITPSGKPRKNFKYSVLAIQYEGQPDKLIRSIVISDSKAGAEWYRATILKLPKVFVETHVVGTPLLSKLIADAESYRDTPPQEPGEKSRSLKTTSITLITPQGKNVLPMDAKSGSSLLEILKKDCKDDESLVSDLSEYQSRILP